MIILQYNIIQDLLSQLILDSIIEKIISIKHKLY